MEQPIYKDGAARILDVLRATFEDQFKQYYDGEPEYVVPEYLPFIMVIPVSTSVSSGASSTDDIIEQVNITLVLNKQDDFGADPEHDELTDAKMRRLLIGQDPQTGQYLNQTVMYALRKNITMGNVMLSNRVDINFNVGVRGAPDHPDILTNEAEAIVTLKRMAVFVNGQS